MDVGEGEGKRFGLPGMRGTRLTGTLGRQALSDRLALKPYWGKPTVRNFRGGDGDVGIIEARSAPSLYPTSDGEGTKRGLAWILATRLREPVAMPPAAPTKSALFRHLPWLRSAGNVT